MTAPLQLFAATTPGLENLAADELLALGAKDVAQVPGGVNFIGDMNMVMAANLWCRIPSRILLRLADFPVAHIAQLHKRSRDRAVWPKILKPNSAVWVRATCTKSPIYHSGAAADRVFKAISEGMQERVQRLLSNQEMENAAAAERPYYQIFTRIIGSHCTLSLDTSGELLYRRGIKTFQGEAPMRETMAAAMLKLAAWDSKSPILDPMCGSGTLALEAALLACNRAPGLQRRFAFEHMQTFDPKAWQTLLNAAKGQEKAAPDRVFAWDRDRKAVAHTQLMFEGAGLQDVAHTACGPLSQVTAPQGPPGIVVCNPPYGERLGNPKTLPKLYAAIGNLMQRGFKGWSLALLTSKERLARATGLTFQEKSAPLPHGGLKVRLYIYRP